MDSVRKSALVTGVLYLVTFITSIPALGLYGPVLNDPSYILGAGADTRIFVGAFLEVLLAISGIGTAVAIFPVVKRQNEGIALGYVAARIVESTIIAVGIVSLLAVVTMRRDFAGSGGTDAGHARHRGQDARRHPQVDVPARARLLRRNRKRADARLPDVPVRPGATAHSRARAGRRHSRLRRGDRGTVRAVLAGLPGGIHPGTAPEALFEASLGIWLIVKGFRPSPIIAPVTRRAEDGGSPVGRPPHSPATSRKHAPGCGCRVASWAG